MKSQLSTYWQIKKWGLFCGSEVAWPPLMLTVNSSRLPSFTCLNVVALWLAVELLVSTRKWHITLNKVAAQCTGKPLTASSKHVTERRHVVDGEILRFKFKKHERLFQIPQHLKSRLESLIMVLISYKKNCSFSLRKTHCFSDANVWKPRKRFKNVSASANVKQCWQTKGGLNTQLYLHVSGVAAHKTLSINIFPTSCRHLAASGPARGFVRRLYMHRKCQQMLPGSSWQPRAITDRLRQGERPVLVGHAADINLDSKGGAWAQLYGLFCQCRYEASLRRRRWLPDKPTPRCFCWVTVKILYLK